MLSRLLFPMLVFAASAGVASDVLPPAPADARILTVGGDIACTNDGDEAAFDLAGLETLAHDEIRTTTIWTDGLQEFEGVPLATLLDAVCAEGTALRARAANAYAIDIPLDDKTLKGALIAYRRNGEPMSLREKGPLWIVFPWDTDPEFATAPFFARSIWQLERIDVID